MTKEKWQNIIGNIKDNFEVLENGQEHLDEEGGVDIDYIVFNGPLGKMRLEFVERPIVLDKKTVYSNRIGAETKVNYVYSEDEKSGSMQAYKWDEADANWVEMDSANFGN